MPNVMLEFLELSQLECRHGHRDCGSGGAGPRAARGFWAGSPCDILGLAQKFENDSQLKLEMTFDPS